MPFVFRGISVRGKRYGWSAVSVLITGFGRLIDSLMRIVFRFSYYQGRIKYD